MSEQVVPTKSAGNLLGNKFVQTILLSHVLLQIGIWVRNFAILMYVTEMTNNNHFAVGLMVFVEIFPIFVFSIIGGTFADRWKPRLTMIWCDILSAISVFAVLLTIIYGSWHMIYLVTFISAILSQFSQPSSMKLFKQHVEPAKLQGAMALFQSLGAIFMVAGPALGVYSYNEFGINISIGIMGVAFLLSAIVLFRIPKDKQPDRTTEVADKQFWNELSAGLKYVWRSPVLKALGGAFVLAGTAVGVAQTLGVFIVIERLGQEKEFLQFLLMVNGIAMLVGGGLVMALAKKLSAPKLLAIGMCISSLTMIGIALSTSVPLTLGIQFLADSDFHSYKLALAQ